MEIIRGLHNIRQRHRGCVSTIGTFDGIHAGHKQLLNLLQAKAQDLGTSSLLVTFEPQPREYFRGALVPARLTRFREKIQILSEEGVSRVLCIPFNERTRRISASAVIEQFLVGMLDVKHLIVGDDFRFGTNAEGNFNMLRQAGDQYGFGVDKAVTVVVDGSRVSSTRIRELLAQGNFDSAARLLGRPYFMMGTVVRGQQLGKSLGIPTANIRLQRYRSAIQGVFAVSVSGLDKEYFGSAYVGTRPTIQGTEPLLEVHLFNYDDDLYGARLRVTFLKKFRDDQEFASIAALHEQMCRDLADAREWLQDREELTY